MAPNQLRWGSEWHGPNLTRWERKGHSTVLKVEEDMAQHQLGWEKEKGHILDPQGEKGSWTGPEAAAQREGDVAQPQSGEGRVVAWLLPSM